MAKKQDIFKDLCKKFGITPDPNWFSTGSTITSEGLNALNRKMEEFYFVSTKPMPSNLQAIFIKFVRGFEDHYRICYGKNIVVRADRLPDGRVGIGFQMGRESEAKEGMQTEFVEWMECATTGDPSRLSTFKNLSAVQQALVKSTWDLQRDMIKQQAIIGSLKGDFREALSSSGLTPPTINVDIRNEVSATALLSVHIDLDPKLLSEISGGLESGDKDKIREALEICAEAEAKQKGYLKKFFESCRAVSGKVLIQQLIGWLKNPENTAGWPTWLAQAIIVALS